MRMPLIALIPAVLLAGAVYAQSEPEAVVPAEEATQVQEEQPITQAQQGEPEAEGEEEEKAPPPPVVETTETTGTWQRSAASGRDTVTYTSTEGEELFSATCMTADTDTGDRIVQIKAVSSEDTIGAIDMFTSAGNARLTAAPDMSRDKAAGITEPVSRPTHVLAAGAGEIKIVSGKRGIVFETDPMLKSVLRDCFPDFSKAVATAPDEDGEDDVAAAEKAEPNS